MTTCCEVASMTRLNLNLVKVLARIFPNRNDAANVNNKVDDCVLIAMQTHGRSSRN